MRGGSIKKNCGGRCSRDGPSGGGIRSIASAALEHDLMSPPHTSLLAPPEVLLPMVFRRAQLAHGFSRTRSAARSLLFGGNERASGAEGNARPPFTATNGRRWDAARRAIISGNEAAAANALKEQVKHLDSEGQDLGFWYPSGALVPDGIYPLLDSSQSLSPSPLGSPSGSVSARSALMGLPRSPLAPLAIEPRDRPTGHSPCLAPRWLPSFLALEVPVTVSSCCGSGNRARPAARARGAAALRARGPDRG